MVRLHFLKTFFRGVTGLSPKNAAAHILVQSKCELKSRFILKRSKCLLWVMNRGRKEKRCNYSLYMYHVHLS